MTDERALRAAVLAAPEDDWPRLVYADYLDDAGASPRAAFIRDQIALSKTPSWEPLAVRARHQQPELLTGQHFLHELPRFGDHGLVEWGPQPFRRGFGWSIRARQMNAFLALAPELFDLEPVGELILPSATLDDWMDFAGSPWLLNVRSLRFTTGSLLSEPVRALIQSPFARNLRSIAFEVSTSPGIAAVVELLVQSPLAKQLTSLEFRIGHDRDGEVLDELCRAEGLALDSLTLATMGQSQESLARLTELPCAKSLKSLAVQHQPAAAALAAALRTGLGNSTLRNVIVLAGQLTGRDVQGFADRAVDSIQSLNLSENIFGVEGVRALCSDARFAQLRSLQLAKCGLDDECLEWIAKAAFWPNLVEIDLRGNHFSDEGVRKLLSREKPRELTAILIGGELSKEVKQDCREHFGAGWFE